MKPGIRTTELLSKLLVDIAATVLVVKGDITPDAWAGIVGATTSVYMVARTALKAVAARGGVAGSAAPPTTPPAAI